MPILVAGAILLLCAAGGIAYWMSSGRKGSAGNGVAAMEPGLPNTPAELNAWYAKPPDAQNAAVIFMRGFEALQIAEADRSSRVLPIIGKGAPLVLGSPLAPNTRQAVGVLVERNKAVWTAFEQARMLEQSRYPLDLTQGPDTLLRHLPKLKDTAQLGQLTALYLADRNEPRAAAGILISSLAAAQSLRQEPVLISQLVRIACLTLAKRSLEHVLNLVCLPDAELAQIATVLGRIETEEAIGTPFARGIIGERASCLAMFELPQAKIEAILKQPEMGGVEPSVLNNLTRNLKAQRAFAEETFNGAIRLSKQPFPERLKVDAYFTSRTAQAKANDFPLCMLLMPALGKQVAKAAGGLATLRLAQVAVALERFRSANHNQYPLSLKELTPTFLLAIPQDPYNGDLLSYTRYGEGYEIGCTGTEPTKPATFRMIKPPKP